jgi:predicted HTH transcriptional regulator
MLKLESIDDLSKIVSDQISESLTLEYKSSAAIGRSNRQSDELTKDVTVFAHSAGGQIIYGIVEQNHKPVRLDEGTDPAIISREWIEQTIDSRVHPRIEGFIIKRARLIKHSIINITSGTIFRTARVELL